MTFDQSNSLAVYGTLAPGEVNHHVVNNIDGQWIQGVIRGYVFEVTWGEADGYPGFYPDPDGHLIPVMVLVSDDLERHWKRIDDFEGPGYRRIEIDVFDVEGAAIIGQACTYECLTDNP